MKLTKIDIYFDGHYQHSTCFYKTCKAAKESALKNWALIVKRDNQGYSRQEISNFTLFVNHPELVRARIDHDFKKRGKQNERIK